MIDYSKKAAVIESGLVQKVKEIRKNKYQAYDDDRIQYYLSLEELLLRNDNPDAFDEASRIANADFRRNTRLKHKIERLMQMGDCVFLTLTFTDDALKLKARTRRDAVTKFLKGCSKYYIANIDYGAKNGREHYHAIVLTDNVDFSKWMYGAINGKRIIKSSNPLKLAKYISKLTNHAVKETCKRNSIIYSRVDWLERSNDYWDAVAPVVEKSPALS